MTAISIFLCMKGKRVSCHFFGHLFDFHGFANAMDWRCYELLVLYRLNRAFLNIVVTNHVI